MIYTYEEPSNSVTYIDILCQPQPWLFVVFLPHRLLDSGPHRHRHMPLNAAQRRKLKEVFDELDTDGSDDLDYQELKDALAKFGVKLSFKELKQCWTAADKDASSGISFDEFVTAVESLPTTLVDRQQSMKALQSKLSNISQPVNDANPGQKTDESGCILC